MFTLSSFFVCAAVHAQAEVPCNVALIQLQNYVAGVNQFANLEFNINIPNRCGPNLMCHQAWQQQLNMWYATQAGMVNGWYGQILQRCTATPASKPPTVPDRVVTNGPPQLGENSIRTLEVDQTNETVRIRIPVNPVGYTQ